MEEESVFRQMATVIKTSNGDRKIPIVTSKGEAVWMDEEQQYSLLEAMQYNDATPSLAQAIKMKKFMQDGKLTDEVIQSIMQEEKPNQREKPAFRDERITKLIPKSVPRGRESDFVVKALEFYNRYLQRNKDRER